jgi:uncharacterized membrane protein
VFLTAIALVEAAVPHLRAGTTPDEVYVRNYVEHPVPALLHVVPGLIFVLGALFQVSARFRRRHLTLHRRMGRVLVVAGIVSAVSALYFGINHPFSGLSEASAAVVFGSWMLWCLGAAFVAIRRRKVAQHRRWMIRAFVVALGITTVRIWTGIFIAASAALSGQPPESDFPQRETFGLAFWLGFGMHVAIAEWWLRRAPRVPATSRQAAPAQL